MGDYSPAAVPPDPNLGYIACFYINGKHDLYNNDLTHSTPWNTLEEARSACYDYIAILNSWYAETQNDPEGQYTDSDPLEDTVHLDTRVGIFVSGTSDGHPSIPTGAYLVNYDDGLDWINL